MPDVEPDWEKSLKVAMMSSISCDREDVQPCFIHDVYYLGKYQVRECHCGQKSERIDFDNNLFAESVSMPALLEELTRLSLERHQKNPPKRQGQGKYQDRGNRNKKKM